MTEYNRTRIRTTRWWWWWWWWWYSTTTISILQRLLWTSETSWVTTKQSEHLGGPGHTSDGAFLPTKILSKAIDFEHPGGREWLPSGTPFQKDYTFFGRVFGPARVRILYVFSLRSGIFCKVNIFCTLSHFLVLFWCSLLRRDPRTSFFGRACYRKRYVKSFGKGFFCNVKKVCSKAPREPKLFYCYNNP